MNTNLINWDNMTTQGFIDLARMEHGDIYDYSQSEYVSRSKKLKIICPIHGVFEQAPSYHLLGHGCNHKECIQLKREQTLIAKYGVKNPMQLAEVMEKYKAACVAKYGSEFALSSKEVRSKIQATMQERYGGNGAMCSEQVREKSKATMVDRYGVENPMQDDGFKSKQQESLFHSLGVMNPMQNSAVKDAQLASRRVSNQANYGVDEVLELPDVRQKIADTNTVRYGSENAMKNPDIVQKNFEVRHQNGTLNSSAPESWLYDELCSCFGSDDVVRQYKDPRYPWACDFYIISRDMFVELNGSWTHGGHWYNAESELDAEKLFDWSLNHKDQPFYQSAAQTWSVLDAAKREAARTNKLNYIVFWDGSIKNNKRHETKDFLYDAALWFAMGCPDGTDWDREYSWLPERKFDKFSILNNLTGTVANISRVVKSFQVYEFYHRELALWRQNPEFRGVSLRIWLYYNRYKYLGKTPDQLSGLEILRGFGIAGILRSYTVFDATLMHKVCDKYNIKSVYDPCAGWGERLLYCYKNNISYYGVDINKNLTPGYDLMTEQYKLTDQRVVFADSAVCDVPDDFDAVITCPPYGNTEIYSDAGSENMPREDFLAWWQQVVYNSIMRHKPKHFCFQVNQAWKPDMSACVENAGYKLVDEFVYESKRVSHMNRRNGSVTKKEYESMLVFECI